MFGALVYEFIHAIITFPNKYSGKTVKSNIKLQNVILTLENSGPSSSLTLDPALKRFMRFTGDIYARFKTKKKRNSFFRYPEHPRHIDTAHY